MELRLPTVVAFLWVVVALARPNTDLSIGASDTKHATKDSSRMKDGIVLDDKHAKTVQPPEAPELLSGTLRKRRQVGWGYSAWGPYGPIGSFYSYNPYTLSTGTGWYNGLGGATAYSGFGPFGMPVAMNQAYLVG